MNRMLICLALGLVLVSSAEAQKRPTKYNITVSVSGSGTVTSSTGGISCPTVCSGSVNSGTAVTFTATPGTGATFSGWGGSCAASGAASTCTLTIAADTTVSATFTGGGGSGTTVPVGTEPNSLLYWNGTQWAELLPPTQSAGSFKLKLVDGGFEWDGPAFAQIVNVNSILNATTDSTGQTFPAGHAPVSVNLLAGTYEIVPVGQKSGGAYTAFDPFTPNNPDRLQWTLDFFTSDNSTPIRVWLGAGNEYPNPETVLGLAPATFFRLQQDGWVRFYLFDNPWTDNAGGVSFMLRRMD